MSSRFTVVHGPFVRGREGMVFLFYSGIASSCPFFLSLCMDLE